MAKRYANLKHIGYIREQDCMICKTDYFVEAHHLLKPWRGSRGMSLKAGDENCVPLCSECHRQLHAQGGELKFFKAKSGREDNGQFWARLLWLSSPHYEELDDK